jgi:adenylate kinase family enzyme
MCKIAIIVNAGGGKSLLARQLGAALSLPVHVIDGVQWQPQWVSTPPADVAAIHTDWLSQPAWIIDGWGDWDLIGQRFAAADTIVWEDFPLALHYW